jgi:hypothetical protein
MLFSPEGVRSEARKVSEKRSFSEIENNWIKKLMSFPKGLILNLDDYGVVVWIGFI